MFCLVSRQYGVSLAGMTNVHWYVEHLKAYLHYFGQERLDLHAWSLTGGYLIKSVLN